MNRIEELLLLWEDDEIDAAQMAELEDLLEDPQNRELLYEHFQTTEAVQSYFLEEGRAGQPAGETAPPVTKKLKASGTRHRTVQTKRSPSVTLARRRRRPRTPSPLLLFGAVASVAAAAVVVVATVIFLKPQSAATGFVGTLHVVQGDVTILRGETELKGVPSSGLRSGDWLILGNRDSKVALTLGDGSNVRAGKEAKILVQSGTQLFVKDGRIELQVSKQPAGSNFVVAGPHSRATVLGTRFAFDAKPLATRLEVTEGRVQYEKMVAGRSAGQLVLPAGYYSIAGQGIEFAMYPLHELVTGRRPKGDQSKVSQDQSVVAVTGFVLVDARSDREIRPLADGATIDLSQDGDALSIRALATLAVRSVRFTRNGRYVQVESVPPYALAGDKDSNYGVWRPTPGQYVITAVPFSGVDGSGERGKMESITVNVVP